MNGPQHYAEAERILASLDAMEANARAVDRISAESYVAARSMALAEAQVHATLSCAAATEPHRHDGFCPPGCSL